MGQKVWAGGKPIGTFCANCNGCRISNRGNTTFLFGRCAGAYAAELAHLVNFVASDTELHPSIEDGLKAQQLADAAAQSLETGMVVAI